MQFMIQIPVESHVGRGAWLEPANIARYAQAAERAGFGALALTDHPAPSQKWLDSGGHESYDPFVGLGFVAGVTQSIRLMTYLTVVPYRNPFIAARSMVSVDRLSGGRAIFALGTGYLRSEFGALDVPFEERNARFDEYMDIIRGAMTTENFSYEGTFVRAVGQTIRPGPVQKPHPPFWIGGNATIGMKRAAKWAQGWAPLGTNAAVAQVSKTRAIDGDDELRVMVEQLRQMVVDSGRDVSTFDVCLPAMSVESARRGAAEALDRAGQLADIGATWLSVGHPHTEVDEAIELLEEFGQRVISPSR